MKHAPSNTVSLCDAITARLLAFFLVLTALLSCSSGGHVQGTMYWNRKVGFVFEIPGGQWTHDKKQARAYEGGKVEAFFVRKGSTPMSRDQIAIVFLDAVPEDVKVFQQQAKQRAQQIGSQVSWIKTRRFGDIETSEMYYTLTPPPSGSKVRWDQHVFLASGKAVLIAFISSRTGSGTDIDEYLPEFEEAMSTLGRI
jgi:hypothetical protein